MTTIMTQASPTSNLGINPLTTLLSVPVVTPAMAG